jgi:hypothetical protein
MPRQLSRGHALTHPKRQGTIIIIAAPLKETAPLGGSLLWRLFEVVRDVTGERNRQIFQRDKGLFLPRKF